MSGRDLPHGTADDSTLTFAEGVEDITDLLEDPDPATGSGPDLGHEDQDHQADADWRPGDKPGPDDEEADGPI